MSLPKFPRQALQVLRIIRAEVPRPEGLPTLMDRDCLRWPGDDDKWDEENSVCCPMGLHPHSLSPQPMGKNFAGRRCFGHGPFEFAYWWDSLALDQAQEAMDFIWGKAEVTT